MNEGLNIHSASSRLLVVGNESQAVLEALEELDGLVPLSVASTAVAQTVLQDARIDLVLLDARLPRAGIAAILEANEDKRLVPILLFAPPGHEDRLLWGIEKGAADTLTVPIAPPLLRARLQAHLQKKLWQEQALFSLDSFDEIEKLADDLRLVILPLGVALSTDHDLDRLLERILVEAMRICNADAGAISLRTEDNSLRYVTLRIDSLDKAFGGTTGVPAPYADLPLYNALGEPDGRHVLTYAVLQEMTINIADVYDEQGFDFSSTMVFDEQNQYRTVSCLTVPLRNDTVIGVLQLRNAQDPRTGEVIAFGPYQQLATESLASQATIALHNHRLRENEVELLRFKRELQIGREIQAGFFPRGLPEPPGWAFAARFQAAREVAGDFYDVFPMPFGHLGLVVADVCDKGLPAALYMALLRSLLRALSLQRFQFADNNASRERLSAFTSQDKADLLDTIKLVNAYVGANHALEYVFATVFFGVLDPLSGRLIYANCGHLPPLLSSAGRPEQRLAPTGPAIGLLPDGRFEAHEIEIQPGETLLIFTDGVTEARDQAGNMFGEQRLFSLLSAGEMEGLTDVLGVIEREVRQHSDGDEMNDDVTMLAVRRM